MIHYDAPVAEEIKFLCTDIILTSQETPEETEKPDGPVLPGQGGDVVVPGIGGN